MSKTGFTLIELLVVVLIIGILSSIALPQYQKAVLKSRYVQVKLLATAIANAQELYHLANNEYASDFDDLVINIGGTPNKNEPKKRRDFNGFFCTMYASATDPRVSCIHSKARLSHMVRFQHSTTSPGGVRECIAFGGDVNDIYNQICKAETGHNPTGGKHTDGGIATGEYYEYRY